MKKRLRMVLMGVTAAGVLAVSGCGDDGGDDDADDETEVDAGDDGDDGGSSGNGGDPADVLSDQFDELGIDQDQAECIVDAQAELDREPGEPIDQEAAQEILDECGVEADE